MPAKAPAAPPLDPLRRITWQAENCLCCKWFRPTDVLNADLFERGACVQPDLKRFNLVVSGRDWCNEFSEITDRQIDAMQSKAMASESG